MLTIDLHAHALIEAVEPLVRRDPRWASELAQQAPRFPVLRATRVVRDIEPT